MSADTLIETETIAGVEIEYHYDWHAGNPFKEFDQAAELVALSPEFGRGYDCAETIDGDRFTSIRHAQRYLTLMRGYLVALPFRFDDYGSSGSQARLVDIDSDRAAGFVCVSPRGVEVTGCPNPEEAARQDFETFRAWVEGDVYGFIVAPGRPETESCFGYYGELDYAKLEARIEAQDIATERARLRALPWLPTFGKPILQSGPVRLRPVPVETVRVGDVLPFGRDRERVIAVDPNVDGRVEIVTEKRTLMYRRGSGPLAVFRSDEPSG
jgi:hypothetical protein